ncbi:MAG: class I SAM-dependent methyltransferase [Anaerolineales bacterium]|nr:class I SAM-dependent methyltransferase [Anaerolineales bacterium]
MFHEIPKPILDRMKELEEIDTRDRQDGTPRIKRLRQVPPETGKVLAFLACTVPAQGAWLEVGTSAGYSALWLSLAAKARGKTLYTFELLPEKTALARETFKQANVEKLIELKNGDARGHVGDFGEVAFCFIDCEKEMYADIFDMVVPNLVADGLVIVDNVINYKQDLADFILRVEGDTSLDTVILPVGKGLMVSRKLAD